MKRQIPNVLKQNNAKIWTNKNSDFDHKFGHFKPNANVQRSIQFGCVQNLNGISRVRNAVGNSYAINQTQLNAFALDLSGCSVNEWPFDYPKSRDRKEGTCSNTELNWDLDFHYNKHSQVHCCVTAVHAVPFPFSLYRDFPDKSLYIFEKHDC